MKEPWQVQRVLGMLVYPPGYRFLKKDEVTENGDIFTASEKGLNWNPAHPGHKPFDGITYCRPRP